MMNRIITDITEYIFVEDKPVKADIIFLPGGSFPIIPEKAASLYHEGYASKLLPAGGTGIKTAHFAGVKDKADIYNKEYSTDCEFYVDVLIKNGVRDKDILKEDKSQHTRDNAFLSRIKTDEAGLDIKKAMIVCKSFHARRCLMLYQLAFPDTEIHVIPVDCYGITKDNWYTFDYGIDRILGELVRCGNQFADDIKGYLKAYSDSSK
ncbi:MAG TPA: YdcF family protein [Clostridia bacterium]|jgi:uncharacterized SAM-binding protein YcdF (DUF218 family)|nr:MAG: hypothetical protein BWX97_00574 [Firmicutes bacterium ADurb.Bin146]HOD93428.1 YdcF family protein [Clostridia bacterium]HQM39672.1 YdcF family protein [Clostridia bacterium]